MIAIRKNPNFSNWFQVFSFGKLVDEFTRRAEAIDLAQDIAKNTKQKMILVEGQPIERTK
jgi:hypothetical protein